MDCIIYVAKTKALISFAVTVKLICVFVFAYVKCFFFSHDAAQMFCGNAARLLQNLAIIDFLSVSFGPRCY